MTAVQPWHWLRARALDIDRLAPGFQRAELGNQGRGLAARLNRCDHTRDALLDVLPLPRKRGLLIGYADAYATCSRR